MTWNHDTGIVSGMPIKTGVYTVTIITDFYDGEYAVEDTVMMTVDALPSWDVGTFRGSVETYGLWWSDACGFEVKVAANGGLSAKLIEPNPA
jgi:hypothetical protein